MNLGTHMAKEKDKKCKGEDKFMNKMTGSEGIARSKKQKR